MTYLLLAATLSAHVQAQTNFYGIARKSTTSTEVFLATVNPTTGLVTNLSTTSLGPSIQLTGAALDPYNNYYHFMNTGRINSVDLSTGSMVRSVPIYNPIEDSYFENFRFNNSDTSLYGLARRVLYDASGTAIGGQVYLSKINVNTGEITQISPSSVGMGFSLGGSAIDPYEKVFYYTSGTRFIGLDMYTGNVWSDATISITDGIIFDNIAYSCADNTIYGLIRQNYYDTVYFDPTDPTMYDVIVDSTAIFLGKINPATGVVTTISPTSIASGGYTLNAGATVDPTRMLYYYNNGTQLVGVSLVTGTISDVRTLAYTNGEHFELMRIQNNCIEATAPRRLPGTAAVGTYNALGKTTSVYPNPATNVLHVKSPVTDAVVIVSDVTGRVCTQQTLTGGNSIINTSNLLSGMYTVKILADGMPAEVISFVKE